MRIYQEINVLEAAEQRISYIFDNYENIIVSVSGGKDSTICFELAYAEAIKRNRKIKCFWLDQEAEYQSSEDIVMEYMERPNVVPLWYQIPLKMTNATGNDSFLNAWHLEEKDLWIRDYNKLSIKENISGKDRFYDFLEWFENNQPESTAHIIGLRSEESLNRFRAVTKNAGVDGINWSTKVKKGGVKFYPIYDWTFEDIFKVLHLKKWSYNKIYDFMNIKNYSINETRVSNLIHEMAFKCLVDLPEFEPQTYQKLLNRGISGISTAQKYAKEQSIYNAKKLPNAFSTWKEYYEHLILTIDAEKADIFKNKMAKVQNSESGYRKVVNAILKNDYEFGIEITKDTETNSKEKWKEIL